MELKIGVVGRILNADVDEPFVVIRDDVSNTGGHLILLSSNPSFTDGHDCWTLADELKAFFTESGWRIDWTQ